MAKLKFIAPLLLLVVLVLVGAGCKKEVGKVLPGEITTERECVATGYYWYNGACHEEKKVGGLPIIDQVTGTEPLTRYPGSVMLIYATSVTDEGNITAITYGTVDSVDMVANWHETQLEGAGWTKAAGGYKRVEEANLAYIKGATEAVEITVAAVREAGIYNNFRVSQPHTRIEVFHSISK